MKELLVQIYSAMAYQHSRLLAQYLELIQREVNTPYIKDGKAYQIRLDSLLKQDIAASRKIIDRLNIGFRKELQDEAILEEANSQLDKIVEMVVKAKNTFQINAVLIGIKTVAESVKHPDELPQLADRIEAIEEINEYLQYCPQDKIKQVLNLIKKLQKA